MGAFGRWVEAMTQSRKDKLQELLAKVEAADKSCLHLKRLPELHTDLVWKSWSGSLDAAKALHEAVLHERLAVVMTYTLRYADECSVRIWHPTDGDWIGRADNPARAWLCAILQALIAECDAIKPPDPRR